MKRDTIKTLIGLVIIAGIVVATFLYGNSQREAQLKRDQTAKTSTTASPSSSTTPAQSVAPAPTATPKVVGNTAPVQSPGSNTLQGNGAPATPKPTATPAPAAGGTGAVAGATISATPTTVPATGGTGADLPAAGSPAAGLFGLGAIIVAIIWLKSSQRAILRVARTRR